MPAGPVQDQLIPAATFLALVGPAWWLAERRGQDPPRAHGVLVRPRGLLVATAVSGGALLLFLGLAAGWAAWQGVPAGQVAWGLAAWRFLRDLLFVALPEEWLFRGVAQPALDPAGGPKGRVLGAPFGRGALLSALLFGAAHALVDLNPARLATAIPGLLFAWLRARTGSILPGVVVHAASNALLVLVLETWKGIGVPGSGR